MKKLTKQEKEKRAKREAEIKKVVDENKVRLYVLQTLYKDPFNEGKYTNLPEIGSRLKWYGEKYAVIEIQKSDNPKGVAIYGIKYSLFKKLFLTILVDGNELAGQALN